MQLDEDTTITLADFTGADNTDQGEWYENLIGDEEPTHDPFADYPAVTFALDGPTLDLSIFVVPMAVTTTLAHNLAVRRANIWACWGTAVVIGWIGNAAHQAECSDHNRDAAGVVHAIDPMVTGDRAKAIVGQCLAHHADLQYVIHNGVIWSITRDWEPRAYLGSNQHTDHVHISGKHGSSHSNSATCTGYNLDAQATVPTFNVCAPVPPQPKPPAPKPSAHAPGTRVLESANPDMSGDDVQFAQRFIGPRHCGHADRFYGPTTTAGVKWYQRMRGIKADGKVGKVTWAQMGIRWHG